MHRRLISVAWLVGASGCTGTGQPWLEAEIQRVVSITKPDVRLQLEVEIEGDKLRGTFQGLLVARSSPPAIRFQLLPDMGTPILDVSATPAAVMGVWHGERVQVWRGAGNDPPLSPLLLFGITLLEQHAQITRARVRSSEAGRAAEPARLHLRGSFPGVEVTAQFQGEQITALTIRRGYVAWRASMQGDRGSVDAPGFALSARVLERESADDLDESLFTLDTPR